MSSYITFKLMNAENKKNILKAYREKNDTWFIINDQEFLIINHAEQNAERK